MENWKSYHRNTRTATYGFLLALPLLVLYEVMILLSSGPQVMQVRVGAEVWIKQILAFIGATGSLILAGIVVLVGVAILVYERKRSIPIRSRYFLWAIAESTVYAVVVAFFVSQVVGLLFSLAHVTSAPALAAPQLLQDQGLFTRLALSIGAGLYEELLFRVLLVGGLFWLFSKIMPQKKYHYLLAALLGALVFSAVHHIGALGDPFTLPVFFFRFLFGLVLNAIFLVRGFGVAAWTHAIYDILIVTHLLG